MPESRTRVRQALVPIVGRPNVGKSTLFNRLIGEERAITGSEPGITRDRISKQLTWDQCQITLVDTAGYENQRVGPDTEFLLRQVEDMIEQGEVILFVVDARDGIQPLDRDIAQKLYPHSERVIVVINKVDPGMDPESARSEFYELGFEQVVPVSAQHNRFLKPLKDEIIRRVPEDTLVIPAEGVRMCLVGRPNVGKSTLFNAVLGYERVMVSDEPGTTRDMVEVSFDVDQQRFHLVDTVGLRRRNRVQEQIERAGILQSIRAIDFSDIACLVMDWNQRVTKQDQRIAGLIQDRYRGCILVITKADQPDEDAEDRWMAHIEQRLPFFDYAPVVFASGVERRGLSDLFETARRIHHQMHRRFEEEPLHNAWLDLKSRISLPSRKTQPVIFQRIRQVDVNPPTFDILTRNPSLLKESDLRHLRRLLREELSLPFSPIKLILSESWEEA